ncbi:hypothetical protein QYH69_06545 [Paraburkholderia sp. SARCC-3016]|jgi:hypothetical protein|uniref:hypothetical protein n=1 Tax=Paraburkholderia sp. SARCC-3016 TaxID=3058611 RepID=UPI002809DA91|nr:hypothetical protein [Paraburkholderia sp. SARCC-3016]MDQ7976901.1 hypothetical protein [Paraburkholderia sp. SARCC-3016]
MSLKRNIETYIRAKDGNRPHLLIDAFAENAELSMLVKTPDIAFPSSVHGRDAIGSVLVREFAARYENVYTFCVSDTPSDTEAFVCDWLVCMTEKAGGAARLGFGQYEWRSAAGLVVRLGISIEEMRVLDKDIAAPILAWAQTRPYPWCTLTQLTADMPPVAALQRVARLLAERTRPT